MSAEGDQTTAGARWQRGRPQALPVIPIESREDMAVMLATQSRLLHERARRHLGDDRSEDAVETAIERTTARLLSRSAPRSRDGLRLTVTVLAEECRRLRTEPTPEAARDRRQPPADRFLGPLNGPLGRVVDRLPPRLRMTLTLAAQGWTMAEIARADNTTEAAVRVRLARARERAQKLMQQGGHTASAVLIVASHRIRRFLGRHVPPGLVEGVTSPIAATAALLPLVVCSLLPAAVQLVPARDSRAAAPPVAFSSTGVTGSDEAPPVPAARPAARTRPAGRASSLASVTAPQLPVDGLHLTGAAGETPVDMRLTAVATLPGMQSSVVVAIGMGQMCGCPVLTQSLDGGMTWESTAGPPSDVTQLALPPTYPSDPRIFAGVDPVAGRAPYEAPAFGQPFQPLTGLPPGRIAVSAHLDDGDPRVFSAALTGLWSIDPTGAGPYTAHEEIDYSGSYAIQAAIGAMATPKPTKGGPALLAWVRSFAVVPGSVGPPPLNPVLVKCPVASACTVASTLPLPPGALATAGPFVVAYTGDAAFVSHDLGASFARLSLPTGARAVASFAFVGPAETPWLNTSMSDGATSVFRLQTSGAWADVSNGERVLHAHIGNLVAIDHGRVLDALVDAGYRCTTADVLRWLPRCP